MELVSGGLWQERVLAVLPNRRVSKVAIRIANVNNNLILC